VNKYDPNIHHRKSIRLKGYDYSKAGLYFVTICVKNRACLFGDVVDGIMNLNHAGSMVKNQWLLLPKRFPNIKLHDFVVMPNHFHAILEITAGATLVVAPVLGDLVGAFQSIATVEYIRGVKNKNWKPFDGKLWQRNYWDNIIWNEKSYQNISKYIVDNPAKWDNDKLK